MSVALHVRSSYTLLQSTLTIPQIVECAKKHGYKAVALTDKFCTVPCSFIMPVKKQQ